MFNNVALDVFIGLVFVYLLYSLMATIVQEIIASFLNLRAVVLVKAIRIMLNDRKNVELKNKSFLGQTWERIVISLETQWHNIACRLPDLSLAKAFYKHPSIKYLSPNVSRSKPSYIEPKNFSATIIQILRGKNFDGSMPVMLAVYNTLFPMVTAAHENEKIPTVEVGQIEPVVAIIQPETLDKLRQLFIDSQKDLNLFSASLEDWYNQTMDRANGWYKRQTRRILFFIGLIVAICGNVDSIKIYHVLSKDKGARDQMVQLAIQSAPKYEAAVNAIKDSLKQSKPNKSDTGKFIITTTGNPILDSAYSDVKNDIEQSGFVLAMGYHHSKKYKQYQFLLQKEDSLQTKQDSLHQAKIVETDSLFQKNKAELKNTKNQIDDIEPEVFDKFDWGSSPLGWLITALALTLSAPFWFDLLSKFISLRSTGKKPDVDTGNTSQPPVVAIASSPATAAALSTNEVVIKSDIQPEFVPDEADDSSIAQG